MCRWGRSGCLPHQFKERLIMEDTKVKEQDLYELIRENNEQAAYLQNLRAIGQDMASEIVYLREFIQRNISDEGG